MHIDYTNELAMYLSWQMYACVMHVSIYQSFELFAYMVRTTSVEIVHIAYF
jgi:hypothetical protein